MDINITEDQRMLQDATRRYLEARAPVTYLRQLVEAQTPMPDIAWREGAGQGWLAPFVPESLGGMAESAQGAIDAAIVAEEMGRVVYPGHYLPNSVLAFAIAQWGSQAQRETLLPALAAGEQRGAWCFAAPGVDSGTAPDGVRLERSGGQITLRGVAANVQSAPDADLLLVTATDGEGVTQLLLPAATAGIEVRALDTLDLGRRLADVEFRDVSVTADAVLGAHGAAADCFEQQLQLALVLHCAETVGVIDRALEFTLDYVQQRYAFGRPIGSFQALKHRLADHAAQHEGGKALVARAAKAVQEQAADAAVAVSIAKSHCGRWATEIIRDCLHMHGGIGMTWEHDIQFYLRRAVSNEALWGSPAVHHERLCRLAGL